MTTATDADDLRDLTGRVNDLEMRVGDLLYRTEAAETHLNSFAKQFEHLRHTLWEMETRLSSLLPRRRHCPKCKNLLHPKAVVCRCGWQQQGARGDPNTGLPVGKPK